MCIQYTWVRNPQNKGESWENAIGFFLCILPLPPKSPILSLSVILSIFFKFCYIYTQWRKRKTGIRRRFALTDRTSQDNPEMICHFQTTHALGLRKKTAKLLRVYWFLQIQNADIQPAATTVVQKYLFRFFTCVRKITKCDYQLRQVCIDFRLSVRPSAWNNSARTWRIFMKFLYFSKTCWENSSFIKVWQE